MQCVQSIRIKSSRQTLLKNLLVCFFAIGMFYASFPTLYASEQTFTASNGINKIVATPLFSQEAYLKSSAPNLDYFFGAALAVDGDTVVVGEPDAGGGAGAAYVFVHSNSAWSLQARLTASNAEFGDRFGTTVAISGDTIVIGAPREDSNATGINGNQNDNSAFDAGAAYVFVRNGEMWSQQTYLKASNTDGGVAPNINGDIFGSAVSISNNTIVIGAPSEDSSASGVNGNQNDNSVSGSGAAYVFERNGNLWNFSTYLKASNSDFSDGFGWAVSIDNESIVVGAPFEDSNAQGINGDQNNNSSSMAGAAYVFVRNSTTWNQQAYLKASNTESLNLGIEGDQFGSRVVIEKDRLIINAPRESSGATGVNGNQSDNSATNAGAVYLFTRSGISWSQQAYLKASNTEARDFFGGSIALNDDLLVIGAVGEDSAATGVRPTKK